MTTETVKRVGNSENILLSLGKSAYREDTHAYKSTDLASKVRGRTSASDHQPAMGCKNTNLLHVSNTAQQNSGTDTFTGHLQTNQNKGTGNLCLPP